MRDAKFIKPNTRPLIAILRGITESEIPAVSEVLINEGISIIEVPLNSPDALKSIKYLVDKYGEEYLVGGGTITTPYEAKSVIDTGAKLVVTPNFNSEVIKSSVDSGCICLPGVLTPTEAFAALSEGAQGLKIFPVSQMGVANFQALMSVLPADTSCFPVGGISSEASTMLPYLKAGAAGFGIGTSLYKVGISLGELRERARMIVRVFDQLINAQFNG